MRVEWRSASSPSPVDRCPACHGKAGVPARFLIGPDDVLSSVRREATATPGLIWHVRRGKSAHPHRDSDDWFRRKA
jgi:hypothetical protein